MKSKSANVQPIFLPYGSIRLLAKKTGYSTVTVSEALAGKTNSVVSQKIRKEAKKLRRNLSN